MGNGRSGVRSKVWAWWLGSIQDPWYAGVRTGWPLKARRSLFPDWPWLCDESSPQRRAMHISVQILAGKFKMEFLPNISLTKAFPVAQIRPNLHKIVPSSMRCWKRFHACLENLCYWECFCRTNAHKKMHLFLGSRNERVSFRNDYWRFGSDYWSSQSD